jgi:hypothetical protein
MPRPPPSGCGRSAGERASVHYRRQTASLEAAAPEIRREAERLGAGMMVVDSLGAARGGEPESADLTIRTFNAARAIGRPWLAVDHVTKAAGNDSTRPFGSTYSHNLARMTWSMDKAQEEGAEQSTLALVNRKRNNGRPLPRMGLQMRVESDEDGSLFAIYFSPCDLAQSDLSHRATVRDRIWAALRNRWLTARELADEIEVPLHQVEVRLTDMKKKGTVRADDQHRWGLASREN